MKRFDCLKNDNRIDLIVFLLLMEKSSFLFFSSNNFLQQIILNKYFFFQRLTYRHFVLQMHTTTKSSSHPPLFLFFSFLFPISSSTHFNFNISFLSFFFYSSFRHSMETICNDHRWREWPRKSIRSTQSSLWNLC